MSENICHVCGVALAFCSAGEAHAAEVSRLREALQAVAKACICGGTGRRMYWPECPTCEADGDEHACSPQREGDCANPACRIARAALATAKAKGG